MLFAVNLHSSVGFMPLKQESLLKRCENIVIFSDKQVSGCQRFDILYITP